VTKCFRATSRLATATLFSSVGKPPSARNQNPEEPIRPNSGIAKIKSVTATEIRRTGLARINQLVRAHRFLEQLRPAFREWASGEVYVCKKTGDYRYRFGDLSKSVTPWSAIARKVFTGPEALAFAAIVLGGQLPQDLTPSLQLAQPAAIANGRANVIALANQEAA
jgi:hypothetical protein